MALKPFLSLLFVLAVFLMPFSSWLSAEIMGYWNLNEGAGIDLMDLSANGYAGVISGSYVNWTTEGYESNALKFTARTSAPYPNVEIALPEDVLNVSEITVSLWINMPPEHRSWGPLFVLRGQSHDWDVEPGEEGELYFYGVGAGVWLGGNTEVPVNDGLWHHIVLTCSLTQNLVMLYVDGEPVGNGSWQSSDPIEMIRLGGPREANQWASFDGILDEVIVYDEALDAAEIVNLYQGGAQFKVSAVSPLSEAVNVGVRPTLEWAVEPEVQNVDVYFGTDPNGHANPKVVNGQTQGLVTQYTPGYLEQGTTFYWVVDARIDNVVNPGITWSFTTTMLPMECPQGDVNGDCNVGMADLLLLSEYWLTDDALADITFDGNVDITDFSVLGHHWLDQIGPVLITELMASNGTVLLDEDGDSSDWIELYNTTASDIVLDGWFIRDSTNQWAFPDGIVMAPGDYLVIFASDKDRSDPNELHTNFKLSADGEYLALIGPDQEVVHEYVVVDGSFPPQEIDVSYGLYSGQHRYFGQATPGQPNLDPYLGLVGDTSFNIDRGFYDAPISVTISSQTQDADIRYTLDGSVPTLTNGLTYDSPIYIDKTTCLRAAAFKPEWYPTNVDTQTYIFLDDVLLQSPDGTPPPGWPANGFEGHTFDYGMDPEIVTDTGSPYYHPGVRGSLLSIPTLSFVTDLDNLFDPTTGIYVNSSMDGRDWERPVSMELIYPDGTEGFQIDAGLRIRGGSSRTSANPQYSFHVYFRSAYGDAKLKYPLFGLPGTEEFDKIDIRTDQGLSWNRDWYSQFHTLVREVYARDLQLAMGYHAPQTRYYHLYIDGVYWGIYETQEYPESFYAETYFGGQEEDYDIIRIEWPDVAPKSGNFDAYYHLWELSEQIAGAPDEDTRTAIYQQMQGNNSDGSRNSAYDVLLDPDSFIDYMIVVFYTASIDGPVTWLDGESTHNWFAIRDRTGEEGFKFFIHDSEFSMGFVSSSTLDVNIDRTGPYSAGSEGFHRFNPQWLHQRLSLSQQYRSDFAERVNIHLFNDGVLTPANAASLFMNRANQVDQAIIAGSARWGDFSRSYPLTHDNWQNEIDWLVNIFIPQRTGILLTQLQNKGLYP